MTNILCGAHLSKRNILKDVQVTGSEVAQVFLGNPRSWKVPPSLSKSEKSFWDECSIPMYVHSSYLVNPASSNPEVREKTIASLNAQFKAASEIKARGLVIHAGQATGSTLKIAAQRWREVFEKVNMHEVQLLVENTAGGSVALGRSIEGIEILWKEIEDFNPKLCLDTCHTWSSNMIDPNLDPYEAFMKVYEDLDALGVNIGLIHANGSKDDRRSGRDRHTNLTDSNFSLNLVKALALETKAPVILETPGPLKILRNELEMLRSS